MVKIYRITTSLKVVESADGKTFTPSKQKFPNAIQVAQLFKSHNNLNLITDPKNKKFLKGSFSNKPLGSRINVLPKGEKLDKAYSLFAPELTIHDEKSNVHWDAIFKNPSGKFAYLYTLEKKGLSKKQKYSRVKNFSKVLPKLKCNLTKFIGKDPIVLPMIILLKTKMRIGNEMYYNKNHHKGLTTLKKHDIKISGDKITFNYIAKDGVPQKITETFSREFINELRKLIKNKKPHDFIFTNSVGHPLKDLDFEKAFEKYCGQKFYPHIVRSTYATEQVQNFIKKNKKPTSEQVKNLYSEIAEALGHKKFSKKKDEWQISYQVTIHHYIQPELVEKLSESIKCPQN